MSINKVNTPPPPPKVTPPWSLDVCESQTSLHELTVLLLLLAVSCFVFTDITDLHFSDRVIRTLSLRTEFTINASKRAKNERVVCL